MIKALFRYATRFHVFLYRRTGGRFAGRVQGLSVLVLTTIGRGTGRTRITPLGFFENDGKYVITASNGGMGSNPGWFFNLRNDPHALIEVGVQAIPVAAEIVGEHERQRLWERLVSLSPGYAEYAKRTKRVIPMVALTLAEPLNQALG